MRFKNKIIQANKLIDEHSPSVDVSQNFELSKIMNVLMKADGKLRDLVA